MARQQRQRRRPASSNTASPITLTINGLTHEGRGVAVYDEMHGDKQGKKIFVNFALPDETVMAKITHSKKSFDEADAVSIMTESQDRQMPFCQHYGVCGGCSLQHLQADAQIAHKQSVLANHLMHHAKVIPDVWLLPLVGDRAAYRSKARLGVRYLSRGNELIVGFRARSSNFLTDVADCPILDVRINEHLQALKDILKQLTARTDITHLEFAAGDEHSQVAMIVRHIKPMNRADQAALVEFCRSVGWQLYLQPKGADSVHRIDAKDLPNTQTVPPVGGLFYHLPDFDLIMECSPLDFTQVNLSVNRQMIKLACELLDLQEGERVLDLFCGLGNFSLPLARMVGQSGQVIGVEGSTQMVRRAEMNAAANGIHHAKFYAQDLTQDFSDEPWAQDVDALLIDPPRAGALEVMAYLSKFNAKRIVYVSCDPATLARDTALITAQGYRLTHAGVMDMFCHTSHVESIVRFEKS